jgi:hypothetical protein
VPRARSSSGCWHGSRSSLSQGGCASKEASPRGRLRLVGARTLRSVGASPLSIVGARTLRLVGARRLRRVGAIPLRLSVQRRFAVSVQADFGLSVPGQLWRRGVSAGGREAVVVGPQHRHARRVRHAAGRCTDARAIAPANKGCNAGDGDASPVCTERRGAPRPASTGLELQVALTRRSRLAPTRRSLLAPTIESGLAPTRRSVRTRRSLRAPSL